MKKQLKQGKKYGLTMKRKREYISMHAIVVKSEK